MTRRTVPPAQLDMALGSRHLQLLAIVVLSVLCCATALAASSRITDCDRLADLQNLEVPAYDISAIAVGHTVADPDEPDDASLDVVPAQIPSEIPILNLTPRVAVILQDIFSAVTIESPSSQPKETPLPIKSAAKGELPLSPVADDVSPSESPELADPVSGIEDVDVAPSIQREMFRTDI